MKATAWLQSPTGVWHIFEHFTGRTYMDGDVTVIEDVGHRVRCGTRFAEGGRFTVQLSLPLGRTCRRCLP